MLNLTRWRQRLHRQRWQWLIRWALLLMVAVCTVTVSAWLALTQMSRAIPEYAKSLVESHAQLAQAQSDLAELTARVQALSSQAKRVDSQRDEMTARWAWIKPVLHAPYVRVLSLEITSERSTVRVQVATPEVLSEALTHELEMTAVRPLGFGYEVTLEAQHAR